MKKETEELLLKMLTIISFALWALAIYLTIQK